MAGSRLHEARAINYIGSKLSLLDEIRGMLKKHSVAGGVFVDVFSGTTIVAQMARQAGFTVIANDWQVYSLVMQRCFLETQGYPAFATLRAAVPAIDGCDARRARPGFGLAPEPGPEAEPLRRVLAFLEDLPAEEGPFFQAYCHGGRDERAYFSRDNGGKLTAVRGAIAKWEAAGYLDPVEAAVLVAAVVETADMLANTASVYGAYLKQVKKSAQAAFVLRLPRLLPPDGRTHRACQEDAAALVTRLADAGQDVEILYMDPPYNQRQYHANYHVLETLARWDLATFTPRGKTGLREGQDQRSPFSSSRRVAAAFAELVGGTNARHVLVSYSAEGLLPEADLVALLANKAGDPARLDLHEIVYKRFRADSDHAQRQYKSDVVREFLFWVEAARP